MKIAYQGEPGAFSEAASRLVSADAALVPCKSFEDVFNAVEHGPAQYGVLPIENSIGGSIHRNYDLLMRFDDRVTGNLRTYALNAKKIHVDIDRAELNKNVPIDSAVSGDVGVVIRG